MSLLALPYHEMPPVIRVKSRMGRYKTAKIACLLDSSNSWYVAHKDGEWYFAAYVRGEQYFFNPVLYLKAGDYSVEIKNGWPEFKRIKRAV